MNINLSKLGDKELAQLCIKHNIIPQSELSKYTKDQVIQTVEKWLALKKQKYQSKANPNIKSVTVNETEAKKKGRPRRNSAPNTGQIKNKNGPPKATVVHRERRMSEPLTPNEKVHAQNDHQMKKQYQQSQQKLQNELRQKNMAKYDAFGIYPPVPRLVAIGDLHGDLRVTLIALKLAGVISKDIFPNNVQDIQWTGGSTWIVQLGDQIDRCRPENWVMNCVGDSDEVIDDEGNNMLIIQIFQKLDAQAKQVGG